jgi:hypothetical protein
MTFEDYTRLKTELLVARRIRKASKQSQNEVVQLIKRVYLVRQQLLDAAAQVAADSSEEDAPQ